MIKGEGFLKLIILYKGVLGGAEVLLAIAIYKIVGGDFNLASDWLAGLVEAQQENSLMNSAFKAGLFGKNAIITATLIIAVIGVLNLIEAYGLHLRQRWAEWLTVIATGAFIPYEFYHLATGPSVLKAVIAVINCAIVYFLAKHKELFKSSKAKTADLQ